MKKKDRIAELTEIIHDLALRDELHLLLEPAEIASVRITKTMGDLSYAMLSPLDMVGKDEVQVNYSAIKPYVTQLYVDIVLITKYVGVEDFSSLKMGKTLASLKDAFGLKLASLLQNTVSALMDGLEKENPTLFGAALRLLHSFVMGLLEMYNVPKEDFYDSVEEYVYFTLADEAEDITANAAFVLKADFKGKTPITLSVKIDRRKKSPFSGFRVTVGNKDTILFDGNTPFKAFLNAAQYINEHTKFKDIKFHLDLKTKSFLNRYSIMFAKEDQLVNKMQDGFYPVLVPKNVTDMEGFLDILTK